MKWTYINTMIVITVTTTINDKKIVKYKTFRVNSNNKVN